MIKRTGLGWLVTLLVWIVAGIVIMFWAMATVILAVIGLLVVGTAWMVVTVWEWLTAVYRWLRATTAILRYLVTGYCGYGGCGYASFYCYWEHCRAGLQPGRVCVRRDMCQYSGEWARPFVPEAGCPIHDSDTWLSQWARKVRRGREQSPWTVVATTWELTETKKEAVK